MHELRHALPSAQCDTNRIDGLPGGAIRSMSPSCHESFISRSPARIMIRFMNESRPVVAHRALRAAVAAAFCACVVSVPPVRAENAPHAIVGAWTLNRNLSDLPDER